MSEYYFPVPVGVLTEGMILASHNEEAFMRYNVARSEVILKFSTRYPDTLAGLSIDGLDHAAALVETQKVEWEAVSAI